MPELTLQSLVEGQWQDMALLELTAPERGADGPCNLEYLDDYFARWVGENTPLAQASLRYPIEWGPRCLGRWPAFLDDLRPLGSARGWWLRRLNLPNDAASDYRLLRETVIAPIGNLRIKEAVPPKEPAPRFPKRALVDREYSFLEYAGSRGAQVGGATGAGGDSPKVLVRVDARRRVWIDAWQDEPANPDRHYLVKFARGQRTPRDLAILRSEYVYYRALARLGIDTIATRGMELAEGENGPSLWLPRFDVERVKGRELRLGVESVYSLVGAPPGAYLKHEAVLEVLRRDLQGADFRAVLLEYLSRDLLNVVFGNSDNHGRNMALLKTPSAVKLAPVYDFAPMVMDPEGVVRATKWTEHEKGDVDWRGLLKSFGRDEPFLRRGLSALARKLKGLRRLLIDLDLPEETLEFPPLGFAHVERRLRDWGLV